MGRHSNGVVNGNGITSDEGSITQSQLLRHGHPAHLLLILVRSPFAILGITPSIVTTTSVSAATGTLTSTSAVAASPFHFDYPGHRNDGGLGRRRLGVGDSSDEASSFGAIGNKCSDGGAANCGEGGESEGGESEGGGGAKTREGGLGLGGERGGGAEDEKRGLGVGGR